MATSWTTTPDFSFSDEDLWKSKITSASATTDFKVVAEAPEDLDLNPEDFEISPEEIQVDNESWVSIELVRADAPGWTLIESGTE